MDSCFLLFPLFIGDEIIKIDKKSFFFVTEEESIICSQIGLFLECQTMIDTKYYNRSQIYSECHDFIFMEIYLIRQGDAFFKGKIRTSDCFKVENEILNSGLFRLGTIHNFWMRMEV